MMVDMKNAADTELQKQIDSAMRRFDAHRGAILAHNRARDAEERFERAVRINRSLVRERAEANLIKMPRSTGFRTP